MKRVNLELGDWHPWPQMTSGAVHQESQDFDEGAMAIGAQTQAGRLDGQTMRWDVGLVAGNAAAFGGFADAADVASDVRGGAVDVDAVVVGGTGPPEWVSRDGKRKNCAGRLRKRWSRWGRDD